MKQKYFKMNLYKISNLRNKYSRENIIHVNYSSIGSSRGRTRFFFSHVLKVQKNIYRYICLRVLHLIFCPRTIYLGRDRTLIYVNAGAGVSNTHGIRQLLSLLSYDRDQLRGFDKLTFRVYSVCEDSYRFTYVKRYACMGVVPTNVCETSRSKEILRFRLTS